jgi:hypothetical protein
LRDSLRCGSNGTKNKSHLARQIKSTGFSFLSLIWLPYREHCNVIYQEEDEELGCFASESGHEVENDVEDGGGDESNWYIGQHVSQTLCNYD